MQEKRKYIRLNAHLEVGWKKIADSAQQPASQGDGTKNISEGGICLNIYEKAVEVGDFLELTITLPDQRIICSRSRVQWIRESKIRKRYDVGLEFLDISSRDREEIKNFVSAALQGRTTS